MNICWITPELGTAAAEPIDSPHMALIDVRDLVDKEGNAKERILAKIDRGVALLSENKKVVICCDYGISRSNAIAAGILAKYKDIALNEAVRIVQKATGIAEIKLGPLNAVRAALGDCVTRSQSKPPSVLITGASGFIGKAAKQRLEKEFSIVAPSSGSVDLESGSAQLNMAVDENNVRCLVHLANPRVYTSNRALGQTLSMLRNVLDVCVAGNITLVYPSSWEIYSGYAGSLLASESVPAFPWGPYGETKYLAEVLIDHYCRRAGLKCAILRCCPLYGMGSERPKFIHTFMAKAIRSEPIVTHRYRNGEPSLDLMHVDDFVEAIFAAVASDFTGTLNLGTGITTSTLAIAEMIKTLLGSSSPIEQAPIDADTPIIAMDNRKAFETLQWQPKGTLRDGIEELLINKGLIERRQLSHVG